VQNNLEPRWQWLSPDELLMDTAWWEIYKNSFPIAEQDTHEQLLHALRLHIAKIGACQHQGVTQAIVVFYPMHTADFSFIFLNYIAVSSQRRGQGLGRQLFNQLIRQLENIIVWEVEDPEAALDFAERTLRAQRLQFYLKEGAQLLNCRFIQPPIDGLNYVPMRLMCHTRANDMDIHLFEKKIVEAIFFKKYKIINKVDLEILNNLLAKIF
jgi:GNAT superfamily N-acetyltransferase